MATIDVQPVTPDRWDDLVRLFGPQGAYSNCWCMWWRVSGAEFDRGIRDRGAGNRAAFESLVAEGREPGLLAYRDGEPVGWCAVAPRDEYAKILRSPVLKPIDDAPEPVWAVTCFYVDRGARRTGVGAALLDEAVRVATRKGAASLEAYPIDTAAPGRTRPPADLFTGTLDLFLRAGFDVVGRRKPARPIVRRTLG